MPPSSRRDSPHTRDAPPFSSHLSFTIVLLLTPPPPAIKERKKVKGSIVAMIRPLNNQKEGREKQKDELHGTISLFKPPHPTSRCTTYFLYIYFAFFHSFFSLS